METVLKVSKEDGEWYSINYHKNVSKVMCSDFKDVMEKLDNYKTNQELFEAEPILTGLSKKEERRILNLRKEVLENKFV